MDKENASAGTTRRSFISRSAALMMATFVAPLVQQDDIAAKNELESMQVSLPLSAEADEPEPGRIKLADFGGVPGAASADIIAAFEQAFAHLANTGGGTLMITPGIYNLGRYSSSAYAIFAHDLQDVEISGYGASLEMTTTAVTMPVFFSFINPSNITVKGLRFYDHGADLSVEWQGAICIDVYTTHRCSGFTTVDCVAEHVVAFFRCHADEPQKYMLTGCSLHAIVRNAYYAVNPKYNASFSSCNIRCTKVRRGFIGFGAKNWDIIISCASEDNAKGSNGFISLVASTAEPCENCDIDLDITGSTNPYSALIHYYHQAEGKQYIRNIRANITLTHATGRATLFLFDHALKTGVQRATCRTFEHIVLTGKVIGKYAGKIIDNPSVSSGAYNDIRISSDLTNVNNIGLVPRYVTIFAAHRGS